MRALGNRLRRRTEDGVTLVEMVIAVALTAVLLTITLTVLNTFTKVETNTESTYAELNQLIPVGTSFQHLLRSAVSPSPTMPPFGTYAARTPKATVSDNSQTFFSNTGRTAPTGKLLGPTKVVAVLTPAGPTGTFTVTTYTAEPNTDASHKGCPGLTTFPTTATCTWIASGRHLVSVGYVDNYATTPTHPTAPKKPVFSYYLVHDHPTQPTTLALLYATPHTTSPTPRATPTRAFATCTLATITGCPADHIQNIKVDLQVRTPGAHSQVESQTVTYELSTVSQTYSKPVG